MEKILKTYIVRMSQEAWLSGTVEVQANSEEEAAELALEIAREGKVCTNIHGTDKFSADDIESA